MIGLSLRNPAFVGALSAVAPTPPPFDPDRFVVRLDTNLRTGSTTVLIPVNARTGGDRTIDWGDGNVTTENSANPTHTYATDGIYTVQMFGGTTTRLGETGGSPNAGWTETLIEIVQWGKAIGWTSFDSAFRGCTQNFGIPNEIPRIADGYAANVTNFQNMIHTAVTFNQDISPWDISNVTTLFGMFRNSSAFNQNIGSWNTANVTTMFNMFNGATAFNQNIGSWNTAAVTNMASMFSNATAFNQDLGAWSLRTAGVTMVNMLNSSGLSTENYSRTLIGWANSVKANSDLPSGESLTATGLTYNNTAYVSGQTYNDAVAARAYLTGTAPDPAWTITDAGEV